MISRTNEPARQAFKADAWNAFRIEARGPSIKTWLNGVPAADYQDSLTPSGFIALQVHGVGLDASRAKSIRLVKDPRDNQLYYLKSNGDLFQVHLAESGASTTSRVYRAIDHGVASNAQGIAIGPDGTIYIVGNLATNGGKYNLARIVKGIPEPSGQRAWSLLAQTEPYPLSGNGFDHLWNGLVVSPDGASLHVNCGSRTDHGEVQSSQGFHPDTRDVALTAKILCLPTSASNLVLRNDTGFLVQAGYLFADGTRNAFDLAFAPNGDLFATDNGPDRDMSDELNWLRRGEHYGFPWRMGGADNPQQFANYVPAEDRLLNAAYPAVRDGYYQNDPNFPPAPVAFAEPVVNLGPDAVNFRDPADGQIKNAGASGQTLATVTAHRSPLGLIFDTAGSMAPPFRHHGFMLSWSPPTLSDPSQDLLDLDLSKIGGTNYQARMTRIAGNFWNPIDAEIISNRVYVLEYGGSQGIWEITFPPAQFTNGAPVLPGQSDRTLPELTMLIVTNTATDADLPVELLNYQMIDPPTGAAIDAEGVITWTPTEAQGPGVYTLTTVVSDGVVSATNSFEVTVMRKPVEPAIFIAAIQDAAGLFSFTASCFPGGVYQIQVSTNLFGWQVIDTITNIDGLFQFQDLASTNCWQRFYRLVAP